MNTLTVRPIVFASKQLLTSIRGMVVAEVDEQLPMTGQKIGFVVQSHFSFGGLKSTGNKVGTEMAN